MCFCPDRPKECVCLCMLQPELPWLTRRYDFAVSPFPRRTGRRACSFHGTNVKYFYSWHFLEDIISEPIFQRSFPSRSYSTQCCQYIWVKRRTYAHTDWLTKQLVKYIYAVIYVVYRSYSLASLACYEPAGQSWTHQQQQQHSAGLNDG